MIASRARRWIVVVAAAAMTGCATHAKLEAPPKPEAVDRPTMRVSSAVDAVEVTGIAQVLVDLFPSTSLPKATEVGLERHLLPAESSGRTWQCTIGRAELEVRNKLTTGSVVFDISLECSEGPGGRLATYRGRFVEPEAKVGFNGVPFQKEFARYLDEAAAQIAPQLLGKSPNS